VRLFVGAGSPHGWVRTGGCLAEVVVWLDGGVRLWATRHAEVRVGGVVAERGHEVAYDAFISYSHAADGRLAPAVQSGLQRLAKPWNSRRALRVFRDDTGLSTNPNLWSSVAAALEESVWFVLLASPEAAASEWVNKEIDHWLKTKPANRILPAVTGGEWGWDSKAGRLVGDAVPARLVRAMVEEPRHLDLRWAHGEAHLDLRNSGFRSAIADLASPMHGIAKDDLEGEDIRQHRHARRLARGAVASLVCLVVAAVVAFGFALANARRADAQTRRAQESARLASQRLTQVEQADVALDAAVTRANTAAADAVRQANLATAQRDLATNASRRAQLAADAATQADAARAQQAAKAQHEAYLAQAASAQAVASAAVATQQRDAALSESAVATQQRDVALSDSLAANANNAFDQGRFDLGLLLAAEATRIDPNAQARSSLLNGLRLEPTLVGHLQGLTTPVQNLAFSLDGRTLAAIGLDGTVDVWDLQTRTLIAQHRPGFCGGIDVNFELGFSPDSQILAYGTCDNTVVLWNPRAGAVLRTFPVPTFDDLSLAFDPTGELIALGTTSSPARVWDIETGRVFGTLPAGCQQPAFSPDDTVVTCAGFSGDGYTIQFWNTHTKKAIGSPQLAYPYPAQSLLGEKIALTFSADSKILTTVLEGSENGPPIIRWNVKTGRAIGTPSGPPLGPDDELLSISPNLQQIVSWNGSGDPLSLLGTSTGQPTGSPLAIPLLGSGTGPLPPVAFSPDGGTLAAGGADGTIRLWQPDATNRLATTLPDRLDDLALPLSPDGRIAVEIAGETVKLVDVATGKPLSHQPPSALLGNIDRGPYSAYSAFSGDSQIFVTISSDSKIRRWDLTTGQQVGPTVSLGNSCPYTGPPQNNLYFLAVSFDGQTAALDNQCEGYAEIVDLDSGYVQTLNTVPLYPTTAAFSPDGRLLTLAGGSTVVLWNVTAGTLAPIQPDQISFADLPDLAFSPDGRTLAAAWTADDTVAIWNVATGQLRQTPSVPLSRPSGSYNTGILAFSPDGSTLATGAVDGTVRLWDVATAEPIGVPFTLLPLINGQPQGYSAPVDALAFTPDGQSLISATQDPGALAGSAGIVRWDLNLSTWQQQDCTIANRNLTTTEWNQYIGPAYPYQPFCTLP